MTCIKTGAVVHMLCHDLVFAADLFEVAGAIVVKANGPLRRKHNAFPPAEFPRRPTHELTDDCGNEFWKEELGVFVIPARCCKEVPR